MANLFTLKLDSPIVSEQQFFYMKFDVSLFERERERSKESKLAS